MLDRNARANVSPAARSERAHMSEPTSEHAVKRYRTLFLSDIHLGTRGAQAELLLDFLKHNDADTILPRRRHHRRLAAEERLVLAAGP